MKSFSELNDFNAALSIEYTDGRTTGVYCYPTNPVNQELTITSTTVAINPGTEIETIVDPVNANVRYQITIQRFGSVPLGASSLSWSSIPANLTLSQVGDVYTISGIQTVTDWNAIKSFTWNLPSDYANATIFYLESKILYYNASIFADSYFRWVTADPEYYGITLEASASVSCNNMIVSPAVANWSVVSSIECDDAYKRGRAYLDSTTELTASIRRNYGLELNANAAVTIAIINRRVRTAISAINTAVTTSTTAVKTARTSIALQTTASISKIILGAQKKYTSNITATASISCTGEIAYVTNNIARTYIANTQSATVFGTTPIQIVGLEATQIFPGYTLRITGTNCKFSLSVDDLPPIGYTFEVKYLLTLTDLNTALSSLVMWPNRGTKNGCGFYMQIYNNLGVMVCGASNNITCNGSASYTPVYLSNPSTITPTAHEAYYVSYDVLSVGAGGGGVYGYEAGGSGGVLESMDYNLSARITAGADPYGPSVKPIISCIKGTGGTAGTSISQPTDGTSSYLINTVDSFTFLAGFGGKKGNDAGNIGGSSGSPQNFAGSTNANGGHGGGAGSAATAAGPGAGRYSRVLANQGLSAVVAPGGYGGVTNPPTQSTLYGAGGNAYDNDILVASAGRAGFIAIRKHVIGALEVTSATLTTTATMTATAV